MPSIKYIPEKPIQSEHCLLGTASRRALGDAHRRSATYCSMDAYNGAYEDLISRARSPEADDDEIHAFKAELNKRLPTPAQSCPAMNCPTPSNTAMAAKRPSSAGCGMTRFAESRPQDRDRRPPRITPTRRTPANQHISTGYPIDHFRGCERALSAVMGHHQRRPLLSVTG
jgi:hypothetical protein